MNGPREAKWPWRGIAQRANTTASLRREIVMSKTHRYTGEFPPLEVLVQYSNWEYALDEEGDEGQDETTIRPEREQRYITSRTSFTVGNATQANGKTCRALLGVADGEVLSVDLFMDDENWRTLIKMPSGWCQSWLPKEKGMLALALSDPNVFPLHVKADLPDAANKRIDLIVETLVERPTFSPRP